MCTESTDAARVAHTLLIPGNKSNSEDLAAAAGNRSISFPGTKRTRPRYAKCGNCEQEFDVAQKKIGNCVYHNGELKCDYGSDMWADEDEDCHGPIDTASNRIEYPEGFYYDCCKQDGTARGCQIGQHVAASTSNKKQRFQEVPLRSGCGVLLFAPGRTRLR
ncbi:MAG: hypothetical protein Q9226_002653 [Calogaya cf. arnoldii]